MVIFRNKDLGDNQIPHWRGLWKSLLTTGTPPHVWTQQQLPFFGALCQQPLWTCSDVPLPVTWPSSPSHLVLPLPGKSESNMPVTWHHHTRGSTQLQAFRPASPWHQGFHIPTLDGPVEEPRAILFSRFQPRDTVWSGWGLFVHTLCRIPRLLPPMSWS